MGEVRGGGGSSVRISGAVEYSTVLAVFCLWALLAWVERGFVSLVSVDAYAVCEGG